VYSRKLLLSLLSLLLLLGPEYGTTKSTLKGALDEADQLADVHLTIKSRLLTEVQAQIKDWKTEHYKRQMVGGCKETKLFEDEFHKVLIFAQTASGNQRTFFFVQFYLTLFKFCLIRSNLLKLTYINATVLSCLYM